MFDRTRRGIIGTAFLFSCAPPAPDIAYITSGTTDQVFALDVLTGQILDSVAVDPRPFESDEPHGVQASPDGKLLYVTAAHGESTLWKFELPELRLIGRVDLGIPGGSRIGITGSGRDGFVPDYYRDSPGHTGEIVRVGLHELLVSDPVPVCPSPHHAEPDPSGTLVAITCSASDEIVILDASSLEIMNRFSTSADPGETTRPLNLVWTPAGDTLYVTLHAANRVAAYTPDGRLVGQFPTGRGPAQIALTHAGILVVPNRTDETVSIGRPSRGPLTTLEIGVAHPHGVAVNPEGTHAVITFEGRSDGPGGAVGIDLTDRAVLWTTIAGAYALGVTIVTHSR